ncbi:10722_t:CDS:2 [Funneliformis mosseae]|uniref:10722_t:CDS:1 n=1 Tax=Funneliformis mosseae TaxID=27381 RepID=A0A9N9DXQ7_FUNMO|nr:10722_t:CDS:2 [Funneliformis mosseae]
MSFKVHESFYIKFNLKGVIEIKDFRPDFIIVKESGDVKSLMICDAKSSKMVQRSHQIQVALYVYLLSLIIQDIPELNVSDTYGIYLSSFDLQEFSVKDLLPEIENFFSEILPRIMKTSNLPWHYNSRCNNCVFTNYCREEAKGTIAMIPNLSHGKAKQLKKITVKQIIKYDEKLKSSFYLKMKPWHVQFVGATTNFPQRTDHNLLISMSWDPLLLRPFGWGICLYASDNEKAIEKKIQCKSISNNEPRKAFIQLMNNFTDLLEKCFKYLKEHDLRACAFVYSEKEKEYIQDSLLDIISIESTKTDIIELKRKAKSCLFNLFEDSKLLLAHKHHKYKLTELPDEWREIPRLVVLEQAIRENVAICVPGFYRLTDIWEQLVKPKLHDQELLNTLYPIKQIDLNNIYSSWNSAVPKLQINNAHSLRIQFGSAVINAYYELLKESTCDIATKLIFETPTFTFTKTKSFKNHYLGKLYFFKQLEAKADYEQIKSERVRDYIRNDIVDGIQIRYEKSIKSKEWIFSILSNKQKLIKLNSNQYYEQVLLVEDSPEGILQAIRFPDMKHMDHQVVQLDKITTSVRIQNIDLQKQKVYLKGTVKLNLDKDKTYLLYERYVNFKVLEILCEIDNRGANSVFMNLLKNTNDWCSNPITLKEGQPKGELLEGRLQIISGQASSTIAPFITWYLSSLHKPTGENTNHITGVTAFSKTAIEKLLEGISVPKQVKIFNLINKNIPLDKVKGINEIPIVIGGTVWDWDKIRKEWKDSWTGCDIMIIVQGTQASEKFDASLAIECLNPETGKLIIVGDEELKPFIRRSYPSFQDHPLLFESIQKCMNNSLKKYK